MPLVRCPGRVLLLKHDRVRLLQLRRPKQSVEFEGVMQLKVRLDLDEFADVVLVLVPIRLADVETDGAARLVCVLGGAVEFSPPLGANSPRQTARALRLRHADPLAAVSRMAVALTAFAARLPLTGPAPTVVVAAQLSVEEVRALAPFVVPCMPATLPIGLRSGVGALRRLASSLLIEGPRLGARRREIARRALPLGVVRARPSHAALRPL